MVETRVPRITPRQWGFAFTPEHIRKVREGVKVRTRRVIARQPPDDVQWFEFAGKLDSPHEPHRRVWAGLRDAASWAEDRRSQAWGMPEALIRSSQPDRVERWRDFAPVAVGDRVAVKEPVWEVTAPATWQGLDLVPGAYYYSLDLAPPKDQPWFGRVLNGRFMPRAAARTWLTILDVQPERLHDMTEQDAVEEGVTFSRREVTWYATKARDRYGAVWDEINGKQWPWDSSDPYVWDILFEVAATGSPA